APRFLAGDWQELLSTLQEKYDIVLAAEAIYKADAYEDLAALLGKCLAAPGGIALFAGKRFYFGCGGGTASFSEFLRQRNFEVEVAHVIEDGRSNTREILRISLGNNKPAGEEKSQQDDKEEAADGEAKRRKLGESFKISGGS
ncbi:unnamed protein product, partial [Polarella glacialis]